MNNAEEDDISLKHHLEEAGSKTGKNIQDKEWANITKFTNERRLQFEDKEFYFKFNPDTENIIVDFYGNQKEFDRDDFEKTMQKVNRLIEKLENKGDKTVYGFFKFLTYEEKCLYSIVRNERHW